MKDRSRTAASSKFLGDPRSQPRMCDLVMLKDKGVVRVILSAVVAGALMHCDDSADDEEFRGPAAGFVNTAEIRLGRQLYMTSGCSLCHGKQARGDGVLAGKYNPKPTDLTNPEAFRGRRDVETLAGVIRDGIGDGELTMPAYGHLSDKDRGRIAHFIRSHWDSEGQSDID